MNSKHQIWVDSPGDGKELGRKGSFEEVCFQHEMEIGKEDKL